MAEERMNHPPVRFDEPMRQAFIDALADCVAESAGGFHVELGSEDDRGARSGQEQLH